MKNFFLLFRHLRESCSIQRKQFIIYNSTEKNHTKYYLLSVAAYMHAGALWLTEAKKSVSLLSFWKSSKLHFFSSLDCQDI